MPLTLSESPKFGPRKGPKSGPQNLDYLNASFGSSPWLGVEALPEKLAPWWKYAQYTGLCPRCSAADSCYGWQVDFDVRLLSCNWLEIKLRGNSKTVEALGPGSLLLGPSRENLARLALWLLVSKFREQYVLHTSYCFFLHTSLKFEVKNVSRMIRWNHHPFHHSKILAPNLISWKVDVAFIDGQSTGAQWNSCWQIPVR